MIGYAGHHRPLVLAPYMPTMHVPQFRYFEILIFSYTLLQPVSRFNCRRKLRTPDEDFLYMMEIVINCWQAMEERTSLPAWRPQFRHPSYSLSQSLYLRV